MGWIAIFLLPIAREMKRGVSGNLSRSPPAFEARRFTFVCFSAHDADRSAPPLRLFTSDNEGGAEPCTLAECSTEQNLTPTTNTPGDVVLLPSAISSPQLSLFPSSLSSDLLNLSAFSPSLIYRSLTRRYTQYLTSGQPPRKPCGFYHRRICQHPF